MKPIPCVADPALFDFEVDQPDKPYRRAEHPATRSLRLGAAQQACLHDCPILADCRRNALPGAAGIIAGQLVTP